MTLGRVEVTLNKVVDKTDYLRRNQAFRKVKYKNIKEFSNLKVVQNQKNPSRTAPLSLRFSSVRCRNCSGRIKSLWRRNSK